MSENGVVPTVFNVGIVTVVFRGHFVVIAFVVIPVAGSVVEFIATGIDVRLVRSAFTISLFEDKLEITAFGIDVLT